MTPAEAGIVLAFFAGSDHGYVVARPGRAPRTHSRPLTADVLKQAVDAGLSVSAPFLAPGASETHVAALDIDREDGLEVAVRACSWLADRQIGASIARSREGRAHVWITVDSIDPPLVPAAVLRRLLARCLADLGTRTRIELRPTVESAHSPYAGGTLRLPGVPHRSTGQTYPLCGPDGMPYGDTLRDWLLGHADQHASGKNVLIAAGPPASRPVSEVRIGFPRIGNRTRWSSRSVSEALRDRYGIEVVAGRSTRCPRHDDRVASLSVLWDDRRAICKAVSCAWSVAGVTADDIRRG